MFRAKGLGFRVYGFGLQTLKAKPQIVLFPYDKFIPIHYAKCSCSVLKNAGSACERRIAQVVMKEPMNAQSVGSSSSPPNVEIEPCNIPLYNPLYSPLNIPY